MTRRSHGDSSVGGRSVSRKCKARGSRADTLNRAGAIFKNDEGGSRQNAQSKNPASNTNFLPYTLANAGNETSTDGGHHKPHE